ncbi:MAG: hypothetical protein ACSLE9_07915 [Burkholderiaceae bacterium]
MTMSATAKNAMLDALTPLITHIGLANAGTELTGGSPAYARQAVAFGAAAAGVAAMTGTETFDVPAGSTVNRVILKGHLTNASPDYGFADLTSEVFGGQGTYQLTALTLTLSDP